MKRFTVILAMFLGWSAFGSAWAAAPVPAAKASPRVTGSQCVGCHEAQSKTHVNHGDCASCHSGAEAHANAAKTGRFDQVAKPARPDTQQCLTCHVKDSKRMNFTFAEHNRAGVQCRDCHGVHSPKVKTLSAGMEKAGKNAALCATCHQDVLARFNMPSHHPVKEGGLSCTGCHDPHAGKQVSLASKTAQCTTCHQRQRGPQAFEHPPVAEDCSNCHNPHGSPNLKLLNVAQPMLCLQCHSLPNIRHGRTASSTATTAGILAERISGAVLRNCTACHSQVHGSSQDQHLRY